jgi:hypothetical protein
MKLCGGAFEQVVEPSAMSLDRSTCEKCGELSAEKENRTMGPLEGSYEHLCPT